MKRLLSCLASLLVLFVVLLTPVESIRANTATELSLDDVVEVMLSDDGEVSVYYRNADGKDANAKCGNYHDDDSYTAAKIGTKLEGLCAESILYLAKEIASSEQLSRIL